MIRDTTRAYGVDRVRASLKALMEADTADGTSAVDIVCVNDTPQTGGIESKLHIFDVMCGLAAAQVDTVVLPSMASHAFIDELQANTPLRVADHIASMYREVRARFPDARRVGILAGEESGANGVFERYFPSPDFVLIYPSRRNVWQIHDATPVLMRSSTFAVASDHAVVDADLDADVDVDADVSADVCADVDPHDLSNRNADAAALELLRARVADMVARGAEVLVATGAVADALACGGWGIPVIDADVCFARDLLTGGEGHSQDAPKVFKVGIVGGVGPAATVDFMQKIVRNTPARCDQDHIKLLVEQNPQIPDRTDNLIGDGQDPTVALYAACKLLESGHASMIAIPCNTAHAFVARLQPHLHIPILNMLTVTAEHVLEACPGIHRVGLLATSGTLASGVYRATLKAFGVQDVTPSPVFQARVMNAIFGPAGVKAGFTTGVCLDDVLAALLELSEAGCDVSVLGCTELPLLFPQPTVTLPNGRTMRLIDPTDILARRCVAQARAARD
jgi:aspartate racemase